MEDEILKRFGVQPEDAERLAADAALAEEKIGIHGVSVTARETQAPASRAKRSDDAEHFVVHNTRSSRDKRHRTVELPKPVTQDVADLFNRVFGRGRP